ncbi:hypothetical protein MesoLjLc_07030 [Mesorhizobium sp. L-8-10]|nr:hypothetical protein MesoLjLc_07030 [Mesorhizobium sp. L-8-10]
MPDMFTLERVETAGQEVKKSRFRAVAGPVSSEDEARDFVARHAEAAANHNCWAWRVGQNCRFFDDGEPSGTAGKPILQVIDGQALDRVAVLVTRWFGGILLGSGGLVRAYGGTAGLCLRSATKLPLVATVKAKVGCGFGDLATVKARLSAVPGVAVVETHFVAAGADLVLSLPEAEAEAILRQVADLTSGRASTSVLP